MTKQIDNTPVKTQDMISTINHPTTTEYSFFAGHIGYSSK